MHFLKIIALISLSLLFADSYTLNRLGSIHMSHPAFSGFYKTTDSSGHVKYNLMMTTFGVNPFATTDTVQIVKDIGSKLNSLSSVKPELVTKGVTWPNEIEEVPDGIFNRKMIAIPEGFLVPFKTKGAISFMDITSNPPQGPYKVTSTHEGDWFYHRVHWQDMDGDGDLDIVTCRAREPTIPIIFGREDEELIWLENPSGNYKTTWTTHVLTHGPDTFFRYTRLNTTQGMKDCIVTSQFFTKSLSVYWTTQINGYYTDTSKLQHRVIDNSIGSVFEIVVTDVNNDGKVDLLVTTNSGSNGTLLVYEIPDDFRTGTYTKHVIDVGFIPRQHMVGKGAPGNVFADRPNASTKGKKPVIFVSGDDDGRAYMYVAKSENANDWTYTKTTIHDAGSGTVGEVAAADVNGDGSLEVFVPAYNKNEIVVYSFAPAPVAVG